MVILLVQLLIFSQHDKLIRTLAHHTQHACKGPTHTHPNACAHACIQANTKGSPNKGIKLIKSTKKKKKKMKNKNHQIHGYNRDQQEGSHV